MAELMTTQEVADYLRLKERKVYDLVRRKRIPCVRVTGKWLFPKAQIDQWLGSAMAPAGGVRPMAPPPPVIAGSHDPLLDWCVGESGCGLALMGGGSLDGLGKLARGEALACGIHILDPADDTYNVTAIEAALGALDAVAIEWAVRDQGLVLAPGNPLGIAGLADLKRTGARIAWRQPASGAHILLSHLLEREGIAPGDLPGTAPLRTETEVGLAVLDGRADAGIAVQAVARQLRLDFLPLHRERYDLVMRRRDYFGPGMQALLAFARSPAAQAKAADLRGYDMTGLGAVRYNGP